jgi:hypothetical protein
MLFLKQLLCHFGDGKMYKAFANFPYNSSLQITTITTATITTTTTTTATAAATTTTTTTEPSDYYDAPKGKVLHFIRGVGLIKG